VSLSPLKKARLLSGKRLIDVFIEIGIQQGRLSMLENGLLKPRQNEIDSLANLYETSPEQIYNCKRWHGHEGQGGA
jgi:hypothetical protein